MFLRACFFVSFFFLCSYFFESLSCIIYFSISCSWNRAFSYSCDCCGLQPILQLLTSFPEDENMFVFGQKQSSQLDMRSLNCDVLLPTMETISSRVQYGEIHSMLLSIKVKNRLPFSVFYQAIVTIVN